MPEPIEFALTEGERHHQLWQRLSAHFEARLRELRGKNDGPLNEIETATLRGQINLLKAIIRLGDEPPMTAELLAHGNAGRF